MHKKARNKFREKIIPFKVFVCLMLKQYRELIVSKAFWRLLVPRMLFRPTLPPTHEASSTSK